MAKVSPVSIKYMIHAKLTAEGALEKPDVIGAVFGQTEGLLGNELEMRELQKEGKIGRIEVELERSDKRTSGTIKIPTALDQSETTLIAAAIETIERVGPCDAQIEVEKIEDVRGSKRDYIIDRAKKLMQALQQGTDSRVISTEVKDAAKTLAIQEYGSEKLPCGDLSGPEVIVVEGRADVVNLLRAGLNNVVGMNGTKLPEGIKELSQDKELTLFVDGDRGGKLIAQNVVDNARIAYIATAPDGKEVEELTGKEILMNLRKRVSVEEFFAREKRTRRSSEASSEAVKSPELQTEKLQTIARENEGEGKALFLDEHLTTLGSSLNKSIISTLKKNRGLIYALIIDGTATPGIIAAAEDARCRVILAKNFTTTETLLTLLSY